MIKTERLVIRPIQLTDAEAMYAYAKNPIIGKMAGWAPHQSIEETQSVIKLLMQVDHNYAIVFDNQMVGTIGFSIIEDVVRLGYVLGQDHWGKGIMHEAVKAMIIYLFQKTNYHTITASTFLDNKKSQNVLFKAGFRFMEQTSELWHNQYMTFNVYQLTKADYERNDLPWQNTTINK